MKIQYHLIYLILTLSVFSCANRRNNTIQSNNLSDFSRIVTFKDLEENGFTPATGEGIDVSILEKRIGDTLVYYQFDNTDNYSEPISLSYQFFIQKSDSSSFISGFKNSGYNILCVTDLSGEKSSFLAKNLSSNLYIEYSIEVTKNSQLKILAHLQYPFLTRAND